MALKKKSLIMLVCAMMIISSVAFGTIAYLTDRAGVKNKFTIGNVDIIVEETEVDEDGDPIPNLNYDPNDPESDPYITTEEGNEYPLVPGSEYVKDPTMTVKEGSKESYVRMMVTINNASQIKTIFEQLKVDYSPDYSNGFVPADYVEGYDKETWVRIGPMKEDTTLNTFTLEFRYFDKVNNTDKVNAEDADVVLPALFNTIKLPGELSPKQLATLVDFAIDVNGNAIQTTGFANADEAWAAFDKQMTATA